MDCEELQSVILFITVFFLERSPPNPNPYWDEIQPFCYGQVSCNVGDPGLSRTSLNNPQGVTFDKNMNVVVADSGFFSLLYVLFF
jgi:hypothetical protein